MKSILFSLYQHFRTLRFRDALSDTLHALQGIVRALFSRHKDSAARMASCEMCEFYDETWRTCGTPGETIEAPSRRLKLGCWCYLPLATRDPEKDCWACANGIVRPDGSKVGWPDSLRPRQRIS